MPGKNVLAQNGVQSGHAVNGGKIIFDSDNPEYIRDLQRPAVIKEDLNEMERRKRVQQILDSKAFRKELEHLIADEREHGNVNAENLHALERLTQLISHRPSNGASASSSPRFGLVSAQYTIPIADLRGTADSSGYTKQERLLRTKLASLFRLIDHFQWGQGARNHITLRISADSEEILINPDGLFYGDISAGALAKVDLHGNILDQGYSRDADLSLTNYRAHLAIHRSRPDLRCVMQLQTPVVVAVSSMEHGLLPICQEAIIVGLVSIHEAHADHLNIDAEAAARDLGPTNKVLLIRNTGFFVCGQSIEEVFHWAYHLVLACETQVRAIRAGIENLCIPNEEARRKTYETVQVGGGGVNRVQSPDKEETIKWRIGELEWEAWMRVLDNAGHHTGHIYRQLVPRTRAPVAQSDVEVPPAACAYGSSDKTESENATLPKTEPTVKWLNSPNVYHKVEFEETGTAAPKKLTKWIPDATTEAAHSNPIKITSPHQFTPASQNPKEFKEKQKAIKEARRAENINAGPQSKILEGVTWEEAAKLKDAEISGTQEMIIIGAASQGIIDPEYRHNAQIYRQLYQPNPFASVTDEEIQNYIHEVERRHGVGGLSDSSFEEVSLMQAAVAREHVKLGNGAHGDLSSATAPSASSIHETSGSTAVERTISLGTGRQGAKLSKVQPSSIGGWFQRSKSDRFGFRKANGRDANQSYGADTTRSAASDEETHKESKSPDKKEKKKRFKTPSFLRSKKDKESKKKSDH